MLAALAVLYVHDRDAANPPWPAGLLHDWAAGTEGPATDWRRADLFDAPQPAEKRVPTSLLARHARTPS
jgi:hypothetical protein